MVMWRLLIFLADRLLELLALVELNLMHLLVVAYHQAYHLTHPTTMSPQLIYLILLLVVL